MASLLLTMIKFGLHVPAAYKHVVHVACWCLLQAAGELELAAQPTLRSSPLGVTQPRDPVLQDIMRLRPGANDQGKSASEGSNKVCCSSIADG